MTYNLTQKYRDYNADLLTNGYITKERYFNLEEQLDKMNTLLIINLN
jgi:hypothetical protein